MIDPDSTPPDFRAGFIALVGKPNVGKSTLVNTLLGEKVAIVSPKPQTTRTRIHGILNSDDAQMIFADTPGICDSGTALRKAMRRIGTQVAQEAEVTLVIIEIPEKPSAKPTVAPEDERLVQAARSTGGHVIVALNKIDRIKPKERMLPWLQLYGETLQAPVMPISALKREGLDLLIEELKKSLPPSPPLFPTDLHTDRAERFLCEELVREQLLFQTHEEVPHAAAVVIESFEDQRDDDSPTGGLCRLEGRIYVERDSQKGIIVGKKGSRIKSVSTKAREAMEELLGSKVYLRLSVHVDSQWTRSMAGVRKFGLDGIIES